MGQAFGCVKVDHFTVGIKETFGKFNDEPLEPGFHCVPWCFGSRLAGRLSLLERKLDFRCETKTTDHYLVNVLASVTFHAFRAPEDGAQEDNNISRDRKRKQLKAFVEQRNIISHIQSQAIDVIREEVAKMDLKSTFQVDRTKTNRMKDAIKLDISGYGFDVVRLHILQIEVKEAMNERNIAGGEIAQAVPGTTNSTSNSTSQASSST